MGTPGTAVPVMRRTRVRTLETAAPVVRRIQGGLGQAMPNIRLSSTRLATSAPVVRRRSVDLPSHRLESIPRIIKVLGDPCSREIK